MVYTHCLELVKLRLRLIGELVEAGLSRAS